jgi:hypothetical protein
MSLFALANWRQIDKVDVYQRLPPGDGQDFSFPAWLVDSVLH